MLDGDGAFRDRKANSDHGTSAYSRHHAKLARQNKGRFRVCVLFEVIVSLALPCRAESIPVSGLVGGSVCALISSLRTALMIVTVQSVLPRRVLVGLITSAVLPILNSGVETISVTDISGHLFCRPTILRVNPVNPIIPIPVR